MQRLPGMSAEALNSVAGDNPEAGAITEVTETKSPQSTQPGPMLLAIARAVARVCPARLVEGLPL
jgi:hypothetical protein